MQQSQRVLDVSHLNVRFPTSERTVDAVRDLSFHVDQGETLASSANPVRASRCRR